MKLINCYVENFGMLKEYSCKFDKGLNCILSDNGSGKTTLSVFIKAMLYGMPDTRRASLSENDRKKYAPWQGGRYGGSLTIEVGRRRYTVERSFGAKASEDSFALIDKDTGAVSRDYSENIGEELFGIDRDGFERTVFLSEKNLSGKNENKSISAKLSDLVGADGDVGGFDNAIDVLEERRKFYHKKGGSGEIGNLKARISECNLAIDGLTAKREGASALEQRNAQLRAELAGAEEVRQRTLSELAAIENGRTKRANEERYREMLAKLGEHRRALSACEEFFGGNMPTHPEVDRARDCWLTGRRLRDNARMEVGDPNLSALSEFFKNGTSFDELDEIGRQAERLDFVKSEMSRIDAGQDEYSTKIGALFTGYIPSEEEVESNIKKASSSGSASRIAMAILGCMLILGGCLLGNLIHYLFYVLAAFGAVIAIFGFAGLGGGKERKEALEFANSIRREDGELRERLRSIAQDLDSYSLLLSKREERRMQLDEESRALSMAILEFLGKFPLTDAPTPRDAVACIREKFKSYYPLYISGENAEKERIEKLKEADELMREAAEFVSRYPVDREDRERDPFTQIRNKINEYNYSNTTVHRLEDECEEFRRVYGITELSESCAESDESSVRARLAELEERITAIRREITLGEREYNECMSECERTEELTARRDELADTLGRYTKNLQIIQKTQALLTEACDLMTSRYIGPTKERFEKYTRMISGEVGEFGVDTSFTLTRTDRGATRAEESYSRGTRDLYALSMRLALIDSLYRDEHPFIILDDPFTALDGKNLAGGKELLKKLGQDRQIIYFTCAKERAF